MGLSLKGALLTLEAAGFNVKDHNFRSALRSGALPEPSRDMAGKFVFDPAYVELMATHFARKKNMVTA